MNSQSHTELHNSSAEICEWCHRDYIHVLYSLWSPDTTSTCLLHLCLQQAVSEGLLPSVLPCCSLPHWSSWAGRQSRVHRCLLPGHSPSAWQTAGTSSSHLGQHAPRWLGPGWRRGEVFTQRDRQSENEWDRPQSTDRSSPQSDSHAGIQVPDLQLSLINTSKHCGPLWGPLDVGHCSLVGGEA